MQVRRAFETGLGDGPAWSDRQPHEFYLACADYLLFSMERLHSQDQLIHDLLRERIAPSESDAHERLRTLDERQGRSRALLESFRGAVTRLRASGGRAVEEFRRGARQFTEEFRALLQPRRNPFFRHTDELFGEADWVLVAGVTAASVAREEELFARVRAAAPPGADPEGFTAEHLPG